METSTSQERPRKRRAINACVNCRTSKVRCDGKSPCQRCERNDTVCQYHDAARDDNILRIDKLEAEVAALRHEMNHLSSVRKLTMYTVFAYTFLCSASRNFVGFIQDLEVVRSPLGVTQICCLAKVFTQTIANCTATCRSQSLPHHISLAKPL